MHYLPSDPAIHALGARVQLEYFGLIMGAVFGIIAVVFYLFGSGL